MHNKKCNNDEAIESDNTDEYNNNVNITHGIICPNTSNKVESEKEENLNLGEVQEENYNKEEIKIEDLEEKENLNINIVSNAKINEINYEDISNIKDLKTKNIIDGKKIKEYRKKGILPSVSGKRFITEIPLTLITILVVSVLFCIPENYILFSKNQNKMLFEIFKNPKPKKILFFVLFSIFSGFYFWVVKKILSKKIVTDLFTNPHFLVTSFTFTSISINFIPKQWPSQFFFFSTCWFTIFYYIIGFKEERDELKIKDLKFTAEISKLRLKQKKKMIFTLFPIFCLILISSNLRYQIIDFYLKKSSSYNLKNAPKVISLLFFLNCFILRMVHLVFYAFHVDDKNVRAKFRNTPTFIYCTLSNLAICSSNTFIAYIFCEISFLFCNKPRIFNVFISYYFVSTIYSIFLNSSASLLVVYNKSFTTDIMSDTISLLLKEENLFNIFFEGYVVIKYTLFATLLNYLYLAISKYLQLRSYDFLFYLSFSVYNMFVLLEVVQANYVSVLL